MAVQRMKYEEKAGYLANNQFIIDLACKKLELSLEQLETIVGRYSRGQRKGELRGCLKWWKITEGGWHNQVGVVKNVGVTLGYRIEDYNGNILVGWKYDVTTALTELKTVPMEVKEPEPVTPALPKIRVTLDYSKSGNTELEIFDYVTTLDVVKLCADHPNWVREVMQGRDFVEESDKRILTVSSL
jgi:hypothetical protein